MKCHTCQVELTAKPKGVSNKGNPYEAFWGHPIGSDCKERIEMSEEDAKKVNLDARAKKFDAELTKFKGMAWFNATNAAVEMVKERHHKGSDAEFTNMVKEYRDMLYKEHIEFFIREIVNEE